MFLLISLFYLFNGRLLKNGGMCEIGGAFSHSIRLSAGVRQGSVLAPSLFALYVDNLLLNLNKSGLGWDIKNFFNVRRRFSIILYFHY